MSEPQAAGPADSLLRARRSPASRRSTAAAAASRCDPTLGCTALVAVAGLLAAAAWFVTGAVLSAPEPQSCVRYEPKECLFMTDPARPVQLPPCAPVPCDFDDGQLECPFHAAGTFVRDRKQDAVEECADPFMEGVPRPLLPSCAAGCCDGGLRGGFVPDKGSRLPGAQQWQPRPPRKGAPANATRCFFEQYTGAEVLHYLQGGQVRILVAGDSMQKQLHARLVHMFRGTRRPIDNRVFTMARYAVCRGGDHYSIAPTYDKQVKGVKPGPTLGVLPDFFGAPPRVPGCAAGDVPAIIDSIYSAWYEWQVKHITAYLETLELGERLVLILGVNFIDGNAKPTKEWLSFLDSIRQRVKVIVMSSPTGNTASKEKVKALQQRNKALRKVGAWAAEGVDFVDFGAIARDRSACTEGLDTSNRALQALQQRNKALRKWASAADGVDFVDFDAMTRDNHRPPSCAHNVHYQCWLDWGGRSAKDSNKPLPGPDENVLREARFGVPVTSVYTTEDGQCRDEMNRNLWQVIFNVMLKWNRR